MAMELNTKGWEVPQQQSGDSGALGTIGGILSKIPATAVVGKVMQGAQVARDMKHGGAAGGLMSGIKKVIGNKVGAGDDVGKEIATAQTEYAQ